MAQIQGGYKPYLIRKSFKVLVAIFNPPQIKTTFTNTSDVTQKDSGFSFKRRGKVCVAHFGNILGDLLEIGYWFKSSMLRREPFLLSFLSLLTAYTARSAGGSDTAQFSHSTEIHQAVAKQCLADGTKLWDYMLLTLLGFHFKIGQKK